MSSGNIQNPLSWPVKLTLDKSFRSTNGDPWNAVICSEQVDTINSLFGKGMWDSYSMSTGWWMITFPLSDPTEEWDTTGHWHVDSYWFKHNPVDCKSGIVCAFYYTGVLLVVEVLLY